MSYLIILVGNIGSGKSTIAEKLAEEGYIILSRDAIRYMIGAGNYIFDTKTEPIVKEGFNNLVETFMKHGKAIVIDETNINKDSRKYYLSLAKRYNYESRAIVMAQLSKDESVARRLQSNHGNNSKEVWEQVWTKFQNMFEEPSEEEGFKEILYFDNTINHKNIIISG